MKRAIGQIKIYVRSIQNSLSVLPLGDSAKAKISDLKEKYTSCHQHFSVSMLRGHVVSCTGNFADTSDHGSADDDPRTFSPNQSDEDKLPEILPKKDQLAETSLPDQSNQSNDKNLLSLGER